ncbi:MAG: hypothetical protein KDD34_09835 [Bdellovibrionales bacterium]|nr:hypothetical protein [Bdellovibrionales bacterium]
MHGKNKQSQWMSIFLCLFLFGCAQLETQNRSTRKSQPPSKDATFDDHATEVNQNDEESNDLQPAPTRPSDLEAPKVGLILGPGMALALSHAGVLREFDKAKIPVSGVVGLGWGAVVGGLYAKKGLANEVQWRIYKLKKEDLPERGFFSSALNGKSVDSVRGFLKDGFAKTMIQQSEIPFGCPMISLRRGLTVWSHSGAMADIIARCLAFPPYFKPVNGDLVGDLFALKESVAFLKKRGAQLIVFVNVLHKGELLPKEYLKDQYMSAILWAEIRKTVQNSYGMMSEVVQVDTTAYQLTDFEKKQALVMKGESAGAEAVKRLREKYRF